MNSDGNNQEDKGSENKDIFSFDDCSILNQCIITIPEAYKMFFDNKSQLRFKNYDRLRILVKKLEELKINKYRYIPTSILLNLNKRFEELVKPYRNSIFMIKVLRQNIIEQFNKHLEELESTYISIKKNEEIEGIKKLFENHEKKLSKESNLPEDDDLKILSGLHSFSCSGKKYLISQDEHFWGYKDLILNNWNIHVIEEWTVDQIKLC